MIRNIQLFNNFKLRVNIASFTNFEKFISMSSMTKRWKVLKRKGLSYKIWNRLMNNRRISTLHHLNHKVLFRQVWFFYWVWTSAETTVKLLPAIKLSICERQKQNTTIFTTNRCGKKDEGALKLIRWSRLKFETG